MPAPTEDEHDSKEWKVVKSLLDDIVSNQQLSDLSSVHKTASLTVASDRVYNTSADAFCVMANIGLYGQRLLRRRRWSISWRSQRRSRVRRGAETTAIIQDWGELIGC
ncbi:hypothetical protein NC652_004981 [Populus alba x Populus x berolinensis]|nr:hypothetical protein NC652_004981 [Populus alba x Populus x berolinensis]